MLQTNQTKIRREIGGQHAGVAELADADWLKTWSGDKFKSYRLNRRIPFAGSTPATCALKSTTVIAVFRYTAYKRSDSLRQTVESFGTMVISTATEWYIKTVSPLIIGGCWNPLWDSSSIGRGLSLLR